MSRWGELKIFAGPAGIALAEEVCAEISKRTDRPVGLGKLECKTHKDGELFVKFRENVRGCDLFIINPTHPPKENAWILRLIAETARDSSAARVTIVPVYLGDNRGDRKDQSRVAVSPAKIMIDFLKGFTSGGNDRVLLLDVHSEPTVGFFKPELIPDMLYASPIAIPYLKTIVADGSFVVASPDKGGGARAIAYAKRLGEPKPVFVHKERPAPGMVNEDVVVIGEVAEKHVLFVDDILDSGGTIITAAKAVKERKARRVSVFVTHAILSDDAVARLDASGVIDEFIFTDTINHSPTKLKTKRMKVTRLSPASLLARAILLLHDDESLSALFE